MHVCERLGKTEDEIVRWPLKRLERWMAYFKVVQEEEEKALKAAKQRGNKPARGPRG